MAKFATLEQVKTQWTIDDVMDAVDVLDIQADIEAQAAAAAKGGR